MIGSRMITVAIKVTTGIRVSDPTSGMRMFSRNMIREFAQNLNYGTRTRHYILFDKKMGRRYQKFQLRWKRESLVQLS